MSYLYEKIQQNVKSWREDGYPIEEYTAIAEILDYATLLESNELRFLRSPQLRALETYWYLRLVENTPHIFALCQSYYSKTVERAALPVTDLLEAFGLDERDDIKDFVLDEGIESLWRRVREDEEFVKEKKLESLHETLTLDYPSYIFALAMGTGKTILIGAIVATEFAMALEYHPNSAGPFIQNALVFAPGLTILESLRELAEVPYDKIIPPRLYQPFESSYKLIFTREGEKDLPIIRGSRYNLVVTNTEKIRIQKRTYRHHTWSQLYYEHMLEQYEETANLRLQALASLPNLGLFSDEAHHTYGRNMDKRLKRVRQTVDYLHEKTNLICVVNTTGTPYYQRQPLHDVVIWYGLSQAIEDNILKSLEHSIYAYDFEPQHTDQFVSEVVRDFFQTYGDVSLPNGAPARLALYFPQTKELRQMRPVVEQTLMEMGYPTDIVLRNTSNSTQAELDAFNHLNEPESPYRVILLVNKGTEGWNCPSLFACALARKLKRSKNFVLQAGTRCLRQVPGNEHKARIYLSMENRGMLDQQLQETFGETISKLTQTTQNTHSKRIKIRKLDMPKLVVKKIIKRIVPVEDVDRTLSSLERPDVEPESMLVRKVYSLQEQPKQASVLKQVAEEEATYTVKGSDLYSTATELAAVHRIDVWTVYSELKRIYGVGGTVPKNHLPKLAAQIEEQTCRYEVKEEEVEEALALVKPDGFEHEELDGDAVYTAKITYQKGKEELLLSWNEMADQNDGDFGFHYEPYNFDSNPERSFFTQMLDAVNLKPEQVEDVYFTGGITDPRKTDFYVEYKGVDDKWHRYTPDFVIRRKDGRCCIVEIKSERMRNDVTDGENGRKAIAIRKWVGMNPDKFQYKMIFSTHGGVAFNKLKHARQFIEE